MKHSAITGTNLHETKGVSSASDDMVLTALSGASVWKFLSPGNGDATLEPFSNGRLHLRHQASSGTNGGSGPSSGGWTTRPLNTVVTNGISGSSLTSNQITLPSGTYIVRGYSLGPQNAQSWSKNLRIRDVTNNVTLKTGFNGPLGPGNSAGVSPVVPTNSPNYISGKFTLASSTLVEVQQWVRQVNTTDTTDWGTALSTGEVEVYADIMFWKIA